MRSPHRSSSVPQPPPRNGGILIVDNYDSFTHNIRNQFGVLGADSRVVRNDAISAADLRKIDPGALVIGPGPGSPHNPEDIGIIPDAIDYALAHDRALLGICLGHQALAAHFGGRVIGAPEVVHGKTSQLEFPRHGRLPDPDLLAGIDPDGHVMRYHSLCVDPSRLPPELAITSVTRDEAEIIMSLQHRKNPLYGVQFHPESFATDDGLKILENFLRLAPGAFRSKTQRTYSFADIPKKAELPFSLVQRLAIAEQKPFEQLEFPCDRPPEEVYALLHAASDNMVCFESLPQDGASAEAHSYFAFDPVFVLKGRNEQLFLDGEPVDTSRQSPFAILAETTRVLQRDARGDVPEGQHFSGGLAGFLSYEAAQYEEPKAFRGETPPYGTDSTFAYGYFDDGLVYNSKTKKYSYFTRGRSRMEYFQQVLEKRLLIIPEPCLGRLDDEVSREKFEYRVKKIQDEEVQTGNAFQVVLSRRKTCSIRGSMVPLYFRLRSISPSPHMHAVKLGHEETMGSLPELAMYSVDGKIAARALAGTARRTGSSELDATAYEKLRKDPKECAEHRMLVDLERNDLARVAELGSVTVPEGLLMRRLDAGPVMHIASEVLGKLRGDVLGIEALLTILPMGTVSGAPKIRAMQIIDHYEVFFRGKYSGKIGFIDVRGNVKATLGLRSIMRTREELTIQAGAGIVMDSVPSKEYDETESKMQMPQKTLEPFLP